MPVELLDPRISLNERKKEQEGYLCTYVNMAQQTRRRKSKRFSSAKRESQIRMTSGSRNSWDKSSVSQRKAKNWGLMFCSCCQTCTKQRMNTCSWPIPSKKCTPCFYPHLHPHTALGCQLLSAQQQNHCLLLRPSCSSYIERKIFNATNFQVYKARKCSSKTQVKEAFLPEGTVCVSSAKLAK